MKNQKTVLSPTNSVRPGLNMASKTPKSLRPMRSMGHTKSLKPKMSVVKVQAQSTTTTR